MSLHEHPLRFATLEPLDAQTRLSLSDAFELKDPVSPVKNIHLYVAGTQVVDKEVAALRRARLLSGSNRATPDINYPSN